MGLAWGEWVAKNPPPSAPPPLLCPYGTSQERYMTRVLIVTITVFTSLLETTETLPLLIYALGV